MLKKVTVLVVTCFIGLTFTSQNALAQEGGAEDPEEEVIVSADSSSTEVLVEEDKPQPVEESFRIPAEETPAPKPIVIDGITPKSITLPSSNTEKTKVKDGKSDVSFNILYYLFYKFKHVDG